MRKSFEENLYQYNEIAKDALAFSENSSQYETELQHLEEVLTWHEKKAAKKRNTSNETQKHIFNIQKRKQEIFQRFKEHCAEIDNPEFVPHIQEGRDTVEQEGETLMVLRKDGSRVPIRLPELMTDGTWGIYYNLSVTIPRIVRKQYLLENTKRSLQALLDKQIVADETGSEYTFSPVKEVYRKKISKKEEEFEGLIAEKMVQSFFQKCAFHAMVDFQIIPADIFYDIHKKIDFIIHRKSYNRGVNVEENMLRNVGIQFTINTQQKNIERKEEQIERARQNLRKEDHIDDIMLVSIPIEKTKEVYAEWEKDKMPGGPDKSWDKEIKEAIFKKVLSGVLEDENIEKQWQLIQNTI